MGFRFVTNSPKPPKSDDVLLPLTYGVQTAELQDFFLYKTCAGDVGFSFFSIGFFRRMPNVDCSCTSLCNLILKVFNFLNFYLFSAAVNGCLSLLVVCWGGDEFMFARGSMLNFWPLSLELLLLLLLSSSCSCFLSDFDFWVNYFLNILPAIVACNSYFISGWPALSEERWLMAPAGRTHF